MKAKHTPGSWKIGDWPQIVATDARETIVCNITGASSNEQATADARLIAAAPDLLEALRAMHDAVAMIVGNDSPVLQSAQAAIAKATGEP